MRLIGLTGSIASGKSTVSKRLLELGARVLDADATAREVTEKGSEGLVKIKAEFGDCVLAQNGELDRKRLAELVFSNPQKLDALNKILHPLIMDSMREQTRRESSASAVIVWDVPLLIEIGANKEVDEVWLVVADDEIRLARAMARDGATRQSVLARMAAQCPQEEKKRHADIIIENDGSVSELIGKVDALYNGTAKKIKKT